MEQQPGHVNWAPYNSNPLEGMVRLWSWEGFAHGAETVSYFRWRQAAFGQEQMHSGLHLPYGSKSPAYYKVEELSRELKAFCDIEKYSSSIALIFDYDANSAWEIQPHGKTYIILT